MQNTYGYVRVSTKEQNEDRQMIAMHDFGVVDGNIYLDKMSGKDFNRPAYIALMEKLQPGDVLVLKSIDRLGRDYEEIIDQWRIITKERRTAIVVLDMPLLDTRAKGKDLTGVFISDLVLQILSYVAQTEREFTRQRQREGIAAARTKGVKFGRTPKERPEEFEELKLAWRQRRISARTAAGILGVHHKTFLRWASE
ncbi:MAG: recombinase family protein [Oscillospiraceae bacterium]|nr:recombinase family protein [Oscillospiraceae bacterium]